jgi:hypothetical protein
MKAAVVGQPGAPFAAQARQSAVATSSPVTSQLKALMPASLAIMGTTALDFVLVVMVHTSKLIIFLWDEKPRPNVIGA